MREKKTVKQTRSRRKNALLKNLLLLGCALAILTFTACGTSNKPVSEDAVTFHVKNKVTDRITSMTASYSFAGETNSTSHVEVAGGGYLNDGELDFTITSEEVSREEDLQKLSVSFRVTEEGGAQFNVATFELPCAFGDSFTFELRYNEGVYELWQIFADGVEARMAS